MWFYFKVQNHTKNHWNKEFHARTAFFPDACQLFKGSRVKVKQKPAVFGGHGDGLTFFCLLHSVITGFFGPLHFFFSREKEHL